MGGCVVYVADLRQAVVVLPIANTTRGCCCVTVLPIGNVPHQRSLMGLSLALINCRCQCTVQLGVCILNPPLLTLMPRCLRRTWRILTYNIQHHSRLVCRVPLCGRCPCAACYPSPQQQRLNSSGGKGSEETAAAALWQCSGSGDYCDSRSLNNKKQNQ